MDTKVEFQAFTVPNGTGPLDIRIVVSKSEYLVVAEDHSCYYIAPAVSLNDHQVIE